MKRNPVRKRILGRVCDVTETAVGIELPDEQVKNVSCMMLVDEVGPEVTNCSPGDFVLYMRADHVFFRDNTHFLVMHDDDVICTLDLSDDEKKRLTIEGKKNYENGRRELEARA